LGFFAEAPACRVIRKGARGQHFQSNVTVQALVVRAIDHTHAAGAYLLENPVVAENFVNHADMLELCVHLMVSNKASQRATCPIVFGDDWNENSRTAVNLEQ
jgi:hypothetical protein